MKSLNLPIGVGIQTKMLGPWKTRHTSPNSISISLVIVPYFSFRRRWRGDFVVNFTVNNLMMTFGVERWSSTAVEDKVRLVGYKKVNTRWIFV